ncbi:MGMT family protein [Collinsella tanakaei]|nr:MGMT family protein [Collinsella tanakaei]
MRSRLRQRRAGALLAACAWLDSYFAAVPPLPLPALHLMGTPFQRRVWRLLLEIPYGRTTTYGALAREYERRFGSRTSARAVGGAIGRNPISIIVPCHRVLGTDGSIAGYAGGVKRKRALLALEGAGR